MFKNQRHIEIMAILKKEGFAEVRALSERLYASQPTIRRDLSFLENQGYVRRSHGGVIPADDTVNTPVAFRRGKRTTEKARICKLAATLLSRSSLVFIDASTTAFHLAEHIKETDDIKVVTNGLPLCSVLAENNVRTFSTGGKLVKSSMAFVGRQAENTVNGFNADLFFFSASSFCEDGTISDYSEEETALRQTMHARASKSVFLCDEDKFNTVSAFTVFSLSDIDHIVTDVLLSESLLKEYGFTLQAQENGAYLYSK
ncbi:MAG: DeoR/GlpR transcriptional regulator [Ruminococcaceae bacterium]|nr:DeoR/GlpR transcriptional regulator [Oscillospiraceae bacterium]